MYQGWSCVRKPKLRYSHSFGSAPPCYHRRKWPTPEDDRNPTLTVYFFSFLKNKISERGIRKDYDITCYTRRETLQSRAPLNGPQLASGPLITFWPPFWDIVFRLISSLPPLLACCCINALGIFCWGPFEGPSFFISESGLWFGRIFYAMYPLILAKRVNWS